MKVKLLILLLYSFSVSGCITTSVKGYADPEFSNYKVSNMAVMTNSNDPAVLDLVLSEVKRKLNDYRVTIYDFWEIVPFSKSGDLKEIKRRLEEYNVDTIFYISFGSSSNTEYYGSINNTTTTFYGNTAYSSGYSTPLVGKSRDSFGSVKLVNVYSNNEVWRGQFASKSSGVLFTGIDVHTKNAIDEIMVEMFRNQYFNKM